MANSLRPVNSFLLFLIEMPCSWAGNCAYARRTGILHAPAKKKQEVTLAAISSCLICTTDHINWRRLGHDMQS